MTPRRRRDLTDAAILVATSAPAIGLARALAPLSPTEAWITAAIAAAGLLLALDFVLGAPVLTRIARRRGSDDPRREMPSARPGRTPRGW